jgi:hypothetical protein
MNSDRNSRFISPEGELWRVYPCALIWSSSYAFHCIVFTRSAEVKGEFQRGWGSGVRTSNIV